MKPENEKLKNKSNQLDAPGKSAAQILDEIEDAWDDLKHDPHNELTPEAIDWLIARIRTLENEKNESLNI